MKEVIAICTHPENKELLNNLMRSLDDYTLRPIIIIVNEAPLILNEVEKFKYANATTYLNHDDGWELGALKFILDNTDYDEIFFMQDSCELKDWGLFDLAFTEHSGKSVAMAFNFTSYIGKYRRAILEKLAIPKIENKKMAVYYEGAFNRDYLALDPEHIILDEKFSFPEHPNATFDEKFGRKNLITTNRWMTKYKAIWSSDRLYELYPELK